MDKGLGAAKPNIKAKSLECGLLIFEVSEQFDEETMDVLEKLCKSDKLKVSENLLILGRFKRWLCICSHS